MNFAKVLDEVAGQEMADIRFLLRLDGVDEQEIRDYFEKAGLLEKFDGIKRTI